MLTDWLCCDDSCVLREILANCAYNESVDVYSFGILLLAFALGSESKIKEQYLSGRHFSGFRIQEGQSFLFQSIAV